MHSIQPPAPRIPHFQSHNCYNLLKIKVIPIVGRIFTTEKSNKMIQVSDTAKNKIASLMQEDGTSIEESFVRVGVESGGCSGLSYKLIFDQEQKEGDKIFEDKGVKIVVDKKSFLYLVGTTLEYSGGLNGKGFIFNNPNAQRTCGCGESFSL